MIRATWRQHRLEMLLASFVLGLAATLALVANHGHAFVAASSDGLAGTVSLMLLVLPVLAGVFIGVPLFARDLEHGNHRLAWTQGVPRPRWIMVKVLLVGGGTMAGATLVGTLMAVIVNNQPLLVTGGHSISAIDDWFWFDQQAPVFPAYVAFALTLGLAAGAVLGRTYPAMAITLAIFTAARVAIATGARPRYLEPLRMPLETMGVIRITADGERNPWLLYQTFQDAEGRSLSQRGVSNAIGAGSQKLADHGVTGWSYYQPYGRFWTFQAIEAVIFFVLAAALLALASYWLHRQS